MRLLFIVYDNESYISEFPIGIACLVAVLEKRGYEIDVYHQDIHHYPETHLLEYLNNNKYDFIGLAFIGGYWQYKKSLAISAAVNASKHRPFYCLGGHGPSPEPAYFLNKMQADAICIGEGDETILDLLDAVSNKRSLSTVKGIAWRDGGEVHVNERRPLIGDINALPFPAYHRFPMDVYRLLRMPHTTNKDFVACILSGRGCPFRCNFCYRMDKGFRPRADEVIIEEIRLLQKDYAINYIAFYDELLMSSEERVLSLCESFLRAGLKFKWECNGRLNYAKPEVLKVMKRSGCVFINYGIECMDDKILKTMHKALKTQQITSGIEATLAEGISPGFNIIFGNIGENKRTLKQGVEFLLRYDDGSQRRTIRPVTPYPGSELYYKAIEWGMLKDCADFYENKHTNSDLMTVNFTELSDDAFYDALMSANNELLNNYNSRLSRNTECELYNLYVKKDASFRGFRQS
jgi:radical SAM superfamily enzyme YgiQ (UPF0313 family)